MAQIIISENMTLDGVVEDPTGADGSRLGGWGTDIDGADRDEWAKIGLQESLDADALLVGRRTYEFFAARFPTRTDPWADRLNSMSKFVMSSTLNHPTWNNTTILTGDIADEVSRLKTELTGTILVYASSLLVPTLIEHDLVDQLRMIIYPVVLGAGRPLFAAVNERKLMRLRDCRIVGTGLALLTYDLTRSAPPTSQTS
jgi:dihydrofolate reductase